MSVYSVNQVRQLYVAKAVKDNVSNLANVGDIAVKADSAKNYLYFSYMGANGLMRSDLIDLKNVISAKATDATAMARPLKALSVKLSDKVNGGVPISGQDYILRLAFRQYVGNSDSDIYCKYGAVHGVANMSASDFYAEMAKSLARNFSREIVPLIEVYLVDHDTTKGAVTTGDVEVPVLKDGKIQSLPALASNHAYTEVIIDEAVQPWVRGKRKQVPVYFEVYPTTVTYEGDEVIWGVVEEETSTASVPNGHSIADLEYFCMGERGDQYRGMGYPNNIDTTYLVDPEIKYNTIDIHYAYVGDGVHSQKSEKDITIVVPKVGQYQNTNNALTNTLIDKINTASGLSIAKLGVATNKE